MTLRHFFEDWHMHLRALPDPRRIEWCTYSIEHLVSLGLLMFCGQSRSRRQLRHDRRTSAFRDNLNAISGGEHTTVADPDTLNYLMERMDPGGLEGLVHKTAHRLIRSRALERFRFEGDYLVAIDGTRLFTYRDHRHCDQCLYAEHKNANVTTYFHEALEAKLITPSGLAISLATAFVENPDGAYDKQECELKTFYNQLAPKLKRLYPRLRICLLMDGLYANENVLRMCRHNGWSYFIVLKEGSLPNLYAEAKRRIGQTGQNIACDQITYSWATNLHQGKETTHAIFSQSPKQRHTKKEFAFVTDCRPSADNVDKLINQGGRSRWKIENQGFNTQKTGGYELEHDYGRNGFAWKNYYFLIQLAHLLMQLMLNTDLFGKLATKSSAVLNGCLSGVQAKRRTALAYYNTIKNFARRFLESFRMQRLSRLGLDSDFPRTIQIRFAPFDTS